MNHVRIFFITALVSVLASCGLTGDLETTSPPVTVITNPVPVTDTPTTTEAPTTEAPTTEAPPTTESINDQIVDWYNDNSDVMDAITAATDDAATAANDYDTFALDAACRDLESAANDGLTRDPIPAPDVNAEWQAALIDYSTSGALCQRALSGGSLDPDMLNEASAAMRTGSEHMTNAADLLERYL